MALGGKFFPACGLNRRDGTGFDFRGTNQFLSLNLFRAKYYFNFFVVLQMKV